MELGMGVIAYMDSISNSNYPCCSCISVICKIRKRGIRMITRTCDCCGRTIINGQVYMTLSRNISHELPNRITYKTLDICIDCRESIDKAIHEVINKEG